MKLTPWFDGSVKPVRVGWYERTFGDGAYRDWWDGLDFRSEPGGYVYAVQNSMKWRGMAQQPKGKK